MELQWISGEGMTPRDLTEIPDLLQKRVIEFAHVNGLPVTSHELYPGVGVGMDGTEHTSGTSRRGYSPKVSPLQIAYGRNEKI